jgi:hypothetical protein
MHSKSGHAIQSILEISVLQVDDPDRPILQHGFRGELVVKTAPVPVWPKDGYDWRLDPLLVDQPGHLRNADDSTVNLVLGVRILPPKPRLYQFKIVDFDASAAMRATISGTYGVPIAEKTGETAFCGDFFEPEVSKTDVEGQKKRWAQFGTT